MTLTRAEIARKLAGRTDVSPARAAVVMDAVFDAIIGALSTGDTVALHGFGRFFTRPKRLAANAAQSPALTVAFRGFGRLRDRINIDGTDLLDKFMPAVVRGERRSEPRDDPDPDGTAIVRLSGIPICSFKLKSVSESGTSFWVREDSVILRNIRVGQEIEIRIHQGAPASSAAMFRARIAHISKSDDPCMGDHFILGVQILDKLAM